MSELRQRLLPIAKPPLALMGAWRDFSASVTERVKSLVDSREVRRAAALLRIYTENLRRTIEGWSGEASSAASRQPVAGAFVKISEGGRALMTLPAKGRELVKLVPEPVQLELRKISTGGAHVCREIFAGILVVGMIAIVGGYGRLAQGPISMPSLVPMIESAINGELSDLHVKIDDAILQRSAEGPGVLFRLRNIRLIDSDGSIVAQAPLAAIGMSGAALLSGRIAPGSVDFIGPRLLFYASDNGLSLSFYRPSSSEVEKFVKGTAPAERPSRSGRASRRFHRRRRRQTAGAADADKCRAPARRDAHGCRCLRAGTPRQHLLPHPLRRQGCAGGAQPGRCRDAVAGSRTSPSTFSTRTSGAS